MKKHTLIRALISITLLVYLAVALNVTGRLSASARCKGMAIEVVDSARCRFVTAEGIDQELGGIRARAAMMPLNAINTDSIERRLDLIDDIEKTECTRMTDGTVLLRVTPMRPVARVFEPDGTSYYINKNGKRMKASLRYRMDVPLVINERGERFEPTSVLPLLATIHNDSLWNSLITAVKAAPDGDILLVPSIRGHVINLGDTSQIAGKLGRVLTMYRKVLPVKGWNLYDTLSVKWRGQVVATHRLKQLPDTGLGSEEIIDEEGDDEGTMTADSTAVKQTTKLL